MTEINDLDRHALLAQSHGHGRKDERRRRVARQVCLFQFGPTVEPHRIENALAGHLFVDEIGDRTSEMACHRQKSDPELLVSRRSCPLGIKEVQIKRCMNQGDKRKPRHCDDDQDFPHRHLEAEVLRLVPRRQWGSFPSSASRSLRRHFACGARQMEDSLPGCLGRQASCSSFPQRTSVDNRLGSLLAESGRMPNFHHFVMRGAIERG